MQTDSTQEKIIPENRHNKAVVRLVFFIVATLVIVAISIIVFFKIRNDIANANSIHFAYVSKDYIDSIVNPDDNLAGIEDIGGVNDIIYSEEQKTDTLVSLKIKDIPNSFSVMKSVSSGYFRDELSEKEVAVYDSIMYAYQNGYNYIGFSNRKFDSAMLSRVTFFIMCDNPYIEINLEHSVITIDGYVYLFFPNMTPEKKEFNDLAYQEAVKITASIPDSLETEYDVAKYLYEYLVCNTQYTVDENYDSSREPALYHALTGQMTNCDGFANALTMLYNIAGVECFNVFYPGNDTAPGHTWCIANIDGKYYHLDPSNDASVYSVINSVDCFSFLCVSDGVKLANSYYHDSIKNIVPKCTDTKYDFTNVDIHIDAIDVQTAMDAAIEYLNSLGLKEDMTDREHFLINFHLLNGMEAGIRDTFIRGLMAKIEEQYIVDGYAYIGAGSLFIVISA